MGKIGRERDRVKKGPHHFDVEGGFLLHVPVVQELISFLWSSCPAPESTQSPSPAVPYHYCYPLYVRYLEATKVWYAYT